MVTLRNNKNKIENILRNESNLIENDYDYFKDLNDDSSFNISNPSVSDSFDDDFLSEENSDNETTSNSNKIEIKRIKKLKTKRGFDISKINNMVKKNMKGKFEKKIKKRKYKYVQSDRAVFIHEVMSQQQLIKQAILNEIDANNNNTFNQDDFDTTNNRLKLRLRNKIKINNEERLKKYTSKIENGEIINKTILFNIDPKEYNNNNKYEFKDIEIKYNEDYDIFDIIIKYDNKGDIKNNKKYKYKCPYSGFGYNNIDEYNKIKYIHLKEQLLNNMIN